MIFIRKINRNTFGAAIALLLSAALWAVPSVDALPPVVYGGCGGVIDGDLAVSGDATFGSISSPGVIGGTTPAPATVTTFTSTAGTIGTADINGGTIDGTVIGGATPAAATVTDFTATTGDFSGDVVVGGTFAADSVSTAEFGYLDGVTSAIQTQLGTKMGDLSDDATPTLGGELEVGEIGVRYDETLSADGTYSGEIINGVYGDTLAFGDLVYLATGDQRWEKTDADAEATAGDVMVAIALESGADGDTKKLLIKGFIREDDWNFTSYGQSMYISTVAGAMTQTAPSASADIVRIIGYAHDDADTIYFNSGNSWVEIQ